MARTRTAPGLVEELAEYLFDGEREEALCFEVTAWLGRSAPFRAFAQAHRGKIRKKLRGAGDVEARRDVRAELRVAQLLLAERRIELAFEAQGALAGGPDFTVSFAGERPFNLEVTRLHGSDTLAPHGGPLLGKLRQLPPSVPNALLIAVESDGAETIDVEAAASALRARADAKDEAFFTKRGFDGSRGFYQRYLRLADVLVWREDADATARVTRWTNRSARIPAPERALRACAACLESG